MDLPDDFLPYSHDLDDAPQLAVVALLWANLLAVERALHSAHPCIAGDPDEREELIGAAIVSLASLLRRALDEYRDAISPQSCSSSGPHLPQSNSRDEIPF